MPRVCPTVHTNGVSYWGYQECDLLWIPRVWPTVDTKGVIYCVYQTWDLLCIPMVWATKDTKNVTYCGYQGCDLLCIPRVWSTVYTKSVTYCGYQGCDLLQPGSHRLNRSINPLDVNIAALRADNLDSTHRWRFITTYTKSSAIRYLRKTCWETLQ